MSHHKLCWWQKKTLSFKTTEKKKKKRKRYLLLGLCLKSFVWSYSVLPCGVISQVILTNEVPVSLAEKYERKQNVVFTWKATAWELLHITSSSSQSKHFILHSEISSSQIQSILCTYWTTFLFLYCTMGGRSFPPILSTIWSNYSVTELRSFHIWPREISIVTALFLLSRLKNEINKKTCIPELLSIAPMNTKMLHPCF